MKGLIQEWRECRNDPHARPMAIGFMVACSVWGALVVGGAVAGYLQAK